MNDPDPIGPTQSMKWLQSSPKAYLRLQFPPGSQLDSPQTDEKTTGLAHFLRGPQLFTSGQNLRFQRPF
jgi:hypothetical protein